MKGAKPDVVAAIGNTPIVRLNHVVDGLESEIYVKMEMLNPAGSMKDRGRAEHHPRRRGARHAAARRHDRRGDQRQHRRRPGDGRGDRGYNCIFVMPDKMSREKIDTLRAYGAKVVICPTAVEPSDPRSYYSVSRRIVEETPGAFYANQYHNPANPEAHYVSTAPEIWEQTGGEFDVFVSGMGTGGTLSGLRPLLQGAQARPQARRRRPDRLALLRVRQDRPPDQALQLLRRGHRRGLPAVDDEPQHPRRHRPGRRPRVLRHDPRPGPPRGHLRGGSCGAAVVGAVKYARTLKQPKRILVLLPDSAQKYLSKIFNDEWMRSNGFFDEDNVGGTVAHILRRKPGRVITASKSTTVREAIQILKEHGISQLPVLDEHQRHCGIVSELDLLNYLVQNEGRLGEPLSDLINSDYATVSPHTRIQLLKSIFNDAKVVLVTEGDRLLGLLSKIDLIDYLASQQ
jgi:cystathionine beta-synthase